MKGMKLSTLMLLIVIFALGISLMMQYRRAATLERRLVNSELEVKERIVRMEKLKADYVSLIRELRGKLEEEARLQAVAEGAVVDGK